MLLENVYVGSITLMKSYPRSGTQDFDFSQLQKENGCSVQRTYWTPDGEMGSMTTNTASEKDIIASIASVYDPEIPVNVYELGLIYAIDIFDGGIINIEMTLTTPNCPSAQELPQQVREAVASVPGVKSVKIDIVWDPPWDISRMSEDARFLLNIF